MSNKSPIFPMPEPQHFSDYGFDPQIDYFQVLEEARKHKREISSSRSIDVLHFKLQKPISKDDSKRIKKNHRKQRWWKNALLFFRRKRSPANTTAAVYGGCTGGTHQVRALSGPVYITESRSGFTTPYRTTSRPLSGPLAGTITPTRKGDLDIPYISLREFNTEHTHRISTSTAMPIYLVT